MVQIAEVSNTAMSQINCGHVHARMPLCRREVEPAAVCKSRAMQESAEYSVLS